MHVGSFHCNKLVIMRHVTGLWILYKWNMSVMDLILSEVFKDFCCRSYGLSISLLKLTSDFREKQICDYRKNLHEYHQNMFWSIGYDLVGQMCFIIFCACFLTFFYFAHLINFIICWSFCSCCLVPTLLGRSLCYW
jgi:hypothetical protein